VPRDLPEICTSPQNPCHEYISKTAQSVAIIVSFMSLLISIYLPEIYLGLGFYSALGLCFGTARACMCMCMHVPACGHPSFQLTMPPPPPPAPQHTRKCTHYPWPFQDPAPPPPPVRVCA
jgi:hypothetical protein